ncbi:hypothetical protein TUBRATIS_20950, partial [Tubulinosema ratisbonensis]
PGSGKTTFIPNLRRKFLTLLRKKHSTPIVVYGPPGSGKTTFILKMLEENNLKPVFLDSLPFFPKYLSENEIGYFDCDTPVKLQPNLIIETRFFFYSDSIIFNLNDSMLKKYSLSRNLHNNSFTLPEGEDELIHSIKKIEFENKLIFDGKFTLLNNLFYKNESIKIPKLLSYIHHCYVDFMDINDLYEVIEDFSFLFSLLIY